MATTYEIVSQIPRTRSMPGGQFETVMNVTFRTKPSRQVGSIDVPSAMYNASEVDRLVAEAAQQIEEIQAL
jgi:hypothetical protein